jgi:hypothetical protein
MVLESLDCQVLLVAPDLQILVPFLWVTTTHKASTMAETDAQASVESMEMMVLMVSEPIQVAFSSLEMAKWDRTVSLAAVVAAAAAADRRVGWSIAPILALAAIQALGLAAVAAAKAGRAVLEAKVDLAAAAVLRFILRAMEPMVS